MLLSLVRIVVHVVLAFCLAALPLRAAQAQEVLGHGPSEFDLVPELETDRDAFTPAMSTVTPQDWIVEASYSYVDNKDAADVNSFPELLARYGISERIELRLGWNYEAGGGGSVVTAQESSEGLDDGGVSYESHALYGVKVDVTSQRGWLPQSCAILEGFTPTSGEQWASQPVVTYAAGWKLPNEWRLDTAMRYAMGNESRNAYNRWAPSVVLRIPLSERWHMHCEYFGVYSQGWIKDTSRGFISPGAHYNFSPNFEVGLRLGWGISTDAANFFANAGFGWRF